MSSSSSTSKKSKPTLWQTLTHSPSQSYLSSAPPHPRQRRVSTTTSTFSPKTPSVSSFHSDSNTTPTSNQTQWVHPSLRRSMAAAGGAQERFEVVEERKKSSSSRRRRTREAVEEQQDGYQQQEQPSSDLVHPQSERQSRRGGGTNEELNRGEGSSTGRTVRETREQQQQQPININNRSSPSPSSSSYNYSNPSSPPLEPPSRNHSHSRSNSFSSSNSGSRLRFGSPSLGTVVEDTSSSPPVTVSEQQRREPTYFNSASTSTSTGRGGWNTSPSAPPPPPSSIPLPPPPPPQQQQRQSRRRPGLSPSSTLNYNPPTSTSSSSYSSPEQQQQQQEQQFVASSSSAPRQPPPPSSTAVTLETLTPPDSEVGLGIRVQESSQSRPLDASKVALKLLDGTTRRRKSVVPDASSESEEDDVFYTPRSSMYSMKSFATGVEDDDEEEEEEEEERRREKDEQGSPPQSSTPTLTLQPPTPLGFPASSRSYGDGEEVEEGGRDLFGEVSFHPERVEKVVGRERERTRSGSSSTESRPSRPTTSRRDRTSTSTSTSSSSFLPSPLSYTHLDDAYSGLAYDDPEPEPLPPPRFPSSSNSNSSSTGSSSSSRPVQPTTPTTTLPSNNVLLSTSGSYPQQLQQQQPSSRSFVPPHLRPFPKRPGSIVSNVSTSSKYSQASYRSEVDAPPPIIIPNPGLNSNSNSTSRPTSLFFSPSLVASPGSLLSNSSLTAPSSPNSQQQQQQYQTPFLPRPTSVLLDSFEGSTRYPSLVASSSAPPSIARGPSPSPSDANASRKSVLSLASFQGAGGGNEVGGKSRRASEGEEKRRRKVGSEAAGLSTVSTYRMPQVMGAAASLGEGAGSSLSGGRGYSTLTLPSGSYRPTTSHTTSSLLSSLLSPSRPLSVVGLPTTSLSTLSLLSSPPPFTTSSSATHPPLSVSYTSHTPPPTKLPSSSVLVRVWAIALDSHDAWAARRAEKGAVVGRSWVGKVVECGENAGGKGFGKGDWVYGLVNAGGGGGAAKEFLVVDRRALAACSAPSGFGSDGNGSGNGNDEWMTLEDLASLPLLGVTAHRSVGGVQRGSRALVLLGGGGGEGAGSDWGVGILAAQELLSKGVLVSIQVVEEWGEEWVREAVVGQEEEKKRRGLDVKVGEPMEVVNGEQEGRFEFVLDCVGGRRVYESSRRVLKSGGVFTSTKTDTTTTTTTTATHSHPTSSSSTKPSSSFLSLRLPLGRLQKDKKDKKKQLTSLVLPPSGSGPPVDSLGEDVRDILEWIAATKPYRPVRVGKVVPFERGGEAFEVLGGREGGGRRRYACEEEVWGVRLVG